MMFDNDVTTRRSSEAEPYLPPIVAAAGEFAEETKGNAQRGKIDTQTSGYRMV
ncbi:hypothetical protein IU500_00235 [Nocardia terpenica]|uniref:hypothetical protein n=1 Tax=Nocardia terpenica TaxID=455432 RepID=UPI001894A62B|nr:hypothetical protein [Nocardia terpenica]MBF6059997.1 hypothetical protein [Nocardia terpenica]MBF6102462.1 hypothetical protein [Nocardia terpenica]MBF6111347.1 hypothetical protein [Nocardia terpenica]MBF6117478.1 hypothetical protein [Nocardia terpenica]MBF6150681.1 hypothetical protein [Nocardia terpenica]